MKATCKTVWAAVLSAVLIFGNAAEMPVYAVEVTTEDSAVLSVGEDATGGSLAADEVSVWDITPADEADDSLADEALDGKEDALTDEASDGNEAEMTETVSEDAVLGMPEEGPDDNDADASDMTEAMPESGSGTAGDPYQVSLNQEVYYENYQNGTPQYFRVTLDKKGYVLPYIGKWNHAYGGLTALGMTIYKDSEAESNIVWAYSYNSSSSHEKTDISKVDDVGGIGLMAGNYLIKVNPGSRTSTFAFQLNYYEKESGINGYEEEIDSSVTPKRIDIGNFFYRGGLHGQLHDLEDFYTFTLSRASTVTVTTGAWKKGWDTFLELYNDEDYTNKLDSCKIELNETVGIKKKLNAGTYYIKITGGVSDKTFDPHFVDYKFKVNASGAAAASSAATGEACVNGEAVTSLKEAFKGMTEAKDYIVELESDMVGEKNLTIPKKPTSVTINGNGHTIQIVGTSLTSNANLILNDVNIKAVTKKNAAEKFTLTAKKQLETGSAVTFEASRVTIKATKEFKLTEDLAANVLTAGTLTLAGNLTVNTLTAGTLALTSSGNLIVGKDVKVTVKSALSSETGGRITLTEDFNKPIVLNGTANGKVTFNGAAFTDGTQIVTAQVKKINAQALKSVFDVTAVTSGTSSAHLCYFSGGKAGIFQDNIIYNGNVYGLWKEAVAQMNADGLQDISVTLDGDVNAKGALTMPKKGYQSITIAGGGHTLTFTGKIVLTGNSTMTDVTLNCVNQKGASVDVKITKGKYSYSGPGDNPAAPAWLLGSWYDPTGHDVSVFTFKEDGTGTWDTTDFTYTVSGSTVTIKTTAKYESVHTFTRKGNKLYGSEDYYIRR